MRQGRARDRTAWAHGTVLFFVSNTEVARNKEAFCFMCFVRDEDFMCVATCYYAHDQLPVMAGGKGSCSVMCVVGGVRQLKAAVGGGSHTPFWSMYFYLCD